MSMLSVENLRRSFGGVQAVNDVSLEVEESEILGLIGPNGSGKTTLFNLVTGVHRPDAGRVAFRGRDTTGWSVYRIARLGLGRTFQIPALFLNMTVFENLLAAAVEAADWKGAPGRAAEILGLLDLERLRDEPAESLSGGQQRLLELGRVLMQDPRLVLLDEVTAGVDPRLRSIILDAVRSLRHEGKTFVVIEHDMEFVSTICDRIVVMDFGSVVAAGDFEAISKDSQVMEAYLGRPVG